MHCTFSIIINIIIIPIIICQMQFRSSAINYYLFIYLFIWWKTENGVSLYPFVPNIRTIISYFQWIRIIKSKMIIIRIQMCIHRVHRYGPGIWTMDIEHEIWMSCIRTITISIIIWIKSHNWVINTRS